MKFSYKQISSSPWFKWLAPVLLIPSLLFNLYFLSLDKSDFSTLVLEVLDGDTLLLEQDVRLRLRQLDAPELEFCAGEESQAFLEDLVKGERVVIKEKILDQRGRAMALVYLDGELINQAVIEAGWGRYHHDQTVATDILRELGDKAKADKIGLYSPECYQTENLDKPKCNIKGNIDPSNSSNKIYHSPGCVHYETTIVEKDRGEEWFCTEAEAKKAGYVKSKRCP